MPHRLTTLRRFKISNDVLILILENLDPGTLYRTCKAFRRVYEIVMDIQPLRYTYELAVAGMRDGRASYSAVSPVARLQILLAYRKDWPKLAWGHETKQQVSSAGPVGVTGGLLYYVENQMIVLLELPSCRKNLSPAQTRCLRYVTNTQTDCVFADPLQSLVVTSQTFGEANGGQGVRLNIRDLSTFGKHAQAISPFYEFGTQITERVSEVSIAVCGTKMLVSVDFHGNIKKHLLMDWPTQQARWLDEQDAHFLNETCLIAAKKLSGASSLVLYNITNIMNISKEREYELPDIWANSILGFGRNAAATTDRSTSKTAMFYCDPSARVLLMTAKPAIPGEGPSHWLFISESYFKPPSRKNPHPYINWAQWSQFCVIRDVPTQIVAEPRVIGTRVIYLETERVSRVEYRSRLGVIDFAPYPETSACQPNRAWTLIGSRTSLSPSETERVIPVTTTDGMKVEGFCATEDNIVLLFAGHHGVKPINTLTFGVPPARATHYDMHSPQL